MKKQFFLLLTLTVLLLTHSVDAMCIPADPGGSAVEVKGDFLGATSASVTVPEEFGDEFMRRFLTDFASIPQEFWSHWHVLQETADADPYHNSYSFYTSMGCEDVFCQDDTHVHWCLDGICQNPDHGHSEAEYAAAATYDPTCPCHRH